MAELLAGLAAMLVAVPSSLAFGVAVYSAADASLAGAGALAGMVGAIALGIVAPLVGRNAGFITAPCAPAAAVLAGLATTLAQKPEMDAARIVALLALTALISAALQVVYGVLHLGRLIKYIPYQVVTGYLSGVAVIIATGQLAKLLGTPGGTPLHAALATPQLWAWQGIAVGAATIVAMLAARRWISYVPAPVVALAAGVLAYLGLGVLDPRLLTTAGNPLVIGPIQASGSLLDAMTARASSIARIDPRDIALVLASAATLSVLLSIDTLKTGVVLDALMSRRHNSNRELLAQGVANFASFAAGGMAGAGAMGPTLVNVTSGARTPWSGVAAGGFALLAFLLFSNLIAWLPIGALAGILLVIAFRMFDFGIFRLLRHTGTRLDFAIIATVIVVAQWFGLIQAAVAGVALAILLFIRDQIGSSVIQRKRDLSHMRSKRRRPEAEIRLLEANGGAAVVIQLQDNLFFGTTDQLLSEIDADLNIRLFVLLDLRRVTSMDYTAAHLFDQMHRRLADRGGSLLLCGLPSSGPARQDIERYLDQVGLTRGAGVRVFDTRDAALEWLEARILAASGWESHDSDERALELGEIALFEGLAPEAIADVAAITERLELKAGDPVFRRNDTGDAIYLVRRGQVHVRLPLPGGKHHHLATFGRGELFGELSFLDHQPRSADAVATTDASLFVLPRARFEAIERENPMLGALFFERLARVTGQRLRLADGELSELEER